MSQNGLKCMPSHSPYFSTPIAASRKRFLELFVSDASGWKLRHGVGATVPSSPPKIQKIQKVRESPPHRHQRIRHDLLITIPSRSARNSNIWVTFCRPGLRRKLRDVPTPTDRPPKTESDEKVLLRPRNRFHRIQHKKLCTETSLDVRNIPSLLRSEFSVLGKSCVTGGDLRCGGECGGWRGRRS